VYSTLEVQPEEGGLPRHKWSESRPTIVSSVTKGCAMLLIVGDHYRDVSRPAGLVCVDMQVKTKFWGKSMELQPIGIVNLQLIK